MAGMIGQRRRRRLSWRGRAASAVLCATLLGCATLPPQGVGDAPAGAVTVEAAPQQAEGYEQPPVLDAKDLLSLDDYASDHHRVDDRVVNDGWTHHYVLHSDYGEAEVVGTEMLQVRVKEVGATAALEEMRRGEEIGEGVKDGVTDVVLGPFRAVRRIFSNPLYAVSAIPSEVFRVLGAAAGAGKLLQSGFDRGVINDAIGFTDAEERLAKELGVDPETTNLPLRRELHDAAKGYFAGAAPIKVASSFIPGVPIPKLTLGDGGASVGKGVDYLREQFSSRNRRNQFRAMDVSRADRKALREHPWISSRRLSATMNALHEVEDAEGRGAYLRAMLDVGSEDGAHHVMRTAQLIRDAHLRLRPIGRIVMVDGRAVCSDTSGGVIMPVYGDHLAWTEQVAAWFEGVPAALEALGATVAAGTGNTVLVSGSVSRQAEASLNRLGFEAIPRAFERLAPPGEPEAKGETEAMRDETNQGPGVRPARKGGRFVRPG